MKHSMKGHPQKQQYRGDVYKVDQGQFNILSAMKKISFLFSIRNNQARKKLSTPGLLCFEMNITLIKDK